MDENFRDDFHPVETQSDSKKTTASCGIAGSKNRHGIQYKTPVSYGKVYVTRRQDPLVGGLENDKRQPARRHSLVLHRYPNFGRQPGRDAQLSVKQRDNSLEENL